jgi:hypothetical protein
VATFWLLTPGGGALEVGVAEDYAGGFLSYSALESGVVAVGSDVDVVEVVVGIDVGVVVGVDVDVVVVSTRLGVGCSSISFFNLRASMRSG